MTRAVDPRLRRLIAVGVLIASLARGDSSDRARAGEPTRLELANGMRVVLAPDPTVSSVVVHVRYDGGAASESANEAGYTHLVERLLFAGSVHLKAGEYEARIDGVGGFTGSVTTADHLAVWEHVPAGALDLALWLEAERLAGFTDAIGDAGIADARTAIATAHRSAYVEQPYALVSREVSRALWGADYRDVLGDGMAAGLATKISVRAFARARIRPRRAVLVIAGAFETDATTRLVHRYFGWIPDRGPAATSAREVVPLTAQARVTITDPLAKVVVAYRMPDANDPARLPLEVAARLLTRIRGEWLQTALIDTGIATEVDATVIRQRGSSELRITVIPKPGTPLGKVGDAVLQAVNQLALRPESEQALARAIATFETAELLALEGLVYRAAYFAEHPLDDVLTLRARLSAISPVLLQRAATTWLDPQAAVIVVGSPEAR